MEADMTNEVNHKSLFLYIKIYFRIVAQDIKSKMSYRADFFISTFGIIFTNVLGFLAFWIVFQNFPSIAGWNFYEILFMYGFSLIALTPNQCMFDNNWSLRTYVYDGSFIKYYFRPVNLYFYYMSEVFDIKGLGQCAFGIVMLCISWSKLAIPVNAVNIIGLVIGLASASLFIIAIMNVAAASCFFIINSGYVMVTTFKFMDYIRYPAVIYNTVFRFLFTFVIPIAFGAYYPTVFLLRPQSVPLLTYLSPVLAVVYFYFSYKLWMLGARKYNGTGN
jgi:ABC-2 type transport system permease protein